MKKIITLFTVAFVCISLHSQECDYTDIIYGAGSIVGNWCMRDTQLIVTGGNVYAPIDPYPYENAVSVPVDDRNAITNLTFSEGVTGIDFRALNRYFENIKTVTLPTTLTYIDERVFDTGYYDIDGNFITHQITELTIPKKVTIIRANAFRHLPLKKITFKSSEPPEFPLAEVLEIIPISEPECFYYNAFFGVTCEAHVPKGSLEKYKEALKYTTLTFKEYEWIVTGVQCTVDSIQGKAGETYQLMYEVFPEKAENKNVIFESGDPSVATVDASGLISFIKSGETVITVTTEDGNFTDKLTITVPKDTDNNLSSLSLWHIYYSPAFDPETTTYHTTIPSDVKRIDVAAQPTSEFSTVSIENNEELDFGDNDVNIKVTSEDGNVKVYNMIVHRMSNESGLKSIEVSGKQIDIIPNKFSYDVYITTQDVIIVNYITVNDKSLSRVEFSQDPTLIKITVIAEDNRFTSTYEVKVKYLSNVAQLQDLVVEVNHDGLDNYNISTLIPPFNPGNFIYDIKIPTDNRILYIKPIPAQNSTVTGHVGFQFDVTTPNVFKLEVTSESGLATNTYFIKVSDKNSTGLNKVQTESGDYKLIHNGGLYKIYLDNKGNKVLN